MTRREASERGQNKLWDHYVACLDYLLKVWIQLEMSSERFVGSEVNGSQGKSESSLPLSFSRCCLTLLNCLNPIQTSQRQLSAIQCEGSSLRFSLRHLSMFEPEEDNGYSQATLQLTFSGLRSWQRDREHCCTFITPNGHIQREKVKVTDYKACLC